MTVRQKTQRFRRRATLRRSVGLLAKFKYEQPEPEIFYGALAEDTVAMCADLYRDSTGKDLTGTLVVDVGGGPGFFADYFTAVGARYAVVETDEGELLRAGDSSAIRICGSGLEMPFADGSIDICLSSNVGEHVPDPWALAEEMLRVTKDDGLLIYSYTVWLSPFGGHETGMWHYLGGERAARRYARRMGKEPKNRYGVTLFPVSTAAGMKWAKSFEGAELIAAFPRYNPRWAWWVVQVPILRELLTANLVLVLRPKRS